MRDPDTRAVEQRVLFTFYTRAEALDALGRGAPGLDVVFHNRMERRYPELRFDWKALDKALARLLPTLPTTSPTAARGSGELPGALANLARHVVLALGGERPALTREAQALLPEVRALGEMLDELRAVSPDGVREGLPSWSFSLLDGEVPPEVEARWSDVLDSGDLDRAEAAFGLLTRAFDDYAEGHNYLGLIALRRGRNDDAVAHFQRTMEVGRRHLPRKVARDRWWSDHATRPYMRGLRNLALTLVRAGRYEEALAACDRLESECHDRITANAHRAGAWLCTKRWAKALEAAHFLHAIYPEESLTAAFAAFELGRHDDARAYLLHATLNAPRTVALVLGESPAAAPHDPTARDIDEAIDVLSALRGFLAGRSAASKRFFRTLWRSELFERLRAERDAAAARWERDHTGADRAAFERLHAMREFAFARQAVGLPPTASFVGEGASRRRPRSATAPNRWTIH